MSAADNMLVGSEVSASLNDPHHRQNLRVRAWRVDEDKVLRDRRPTFRSKEPRSPSRIGASEWMSLTPACIDDSLDIIRMEHEMQATINMVWMHDLAAEGPGKRIANAVALREDSHRALLQEANVGMKVVRVLGRKVIEAGQEVVEDWTWSL